MRENRDPMSVRCSVTQARHDSDTLDTGGGARDPAPGTNSRPRPPAGSQSEPVASPSRKRAKPSRHVPGSLNELELPSARNRPAGKWKRSKP